MKQTPVTIIAGPCSINEENQDQLFDIAKLSISSPAGNKRVIWGLRVVGLKSRTVIAQDGVGMGIDFHTYMKNMNHFIEDNETHSFEDLPSALLAKRIIEETGLVVATEIVDPLIQLPSYEKVIPKGKLLAWNPAVNQIGYSSLVMGKYVARNNWYLGIKNGKWLGETSESTMTSMEKTWVGLSSYAEEGGLSKQSDRTILIHRGVDIAGKGEFRSLPVHDAAQRVKQHTSTRLFFDPSHTYGPMLQHRIVDETIEALKLKVSDGEYLYDGVLIEVGDSPTDTHQHITISELETLCQKISLFREIQSPN